MNQLTEHNNIIIGDWVSFYLNGELVISIVHYIFKKNGIIYIATMYGKIDAESILENRHKQQLTKG